LPPADILFRRFRTIEKTGLYRGGVRKMGARRPLLPGTKDLRRFSLPYPSYRLPAPSYGPSSAMPVCDGRLDRRGSGTMGGQVPPVNERPDAGKPDKGVMKE